ncbi:MAG TPA: hypothetical protein VM430_00125 [Microbacterium sp.]|nr:hypothetical protein [Microbacterium sp.]
MANMKEVWTVSPRGEGKKDFWLRVGTAFENRDGSWSLVLDALPVNGKLIVRDQREREDRNDPSSARRQARAPARDDDFNYGANADEQF